MCDSERDAVLELAAERAYTAQTIFMLIDSDADGYVGTEQLGIMLTSLLLSQELNFEGDVEEFVLQTARHRHLTRASFSDFVDLYNSLVDRIKLHECIAPPPWPSASHTPQPTATHTSGPSSSGGAPSAVCVSRRLSAAYLVSGAALIGINGVYTQSGESDGVPKYSYDCFSLLRRSLPGGVKSWYLIEAASADSRSSGSQSTLHYYYCYRSNSGTPPLEGAWEKGKDGISPGPFLLPISMTMHAPPTSVQAPLGSFEVRDYVRANWAGRGVLYPGEVLATNREDDSVDILYDDGDFESHVPRDRVHSVSIELTDAFHAFSVGDVVKADMKGHGSWYTGRIIAIDTKYRVFTIKYENSHLEKHVPPSRVQPLSSGHVKTDYVLGERVRANWQSCGTWCLGRICAVNSAESTFDVQYDDGEVEAHVAAHSLQPAEDAEPKTEAPGSAEALPFACSLVSKAADLGTPDRRVL
uniref:EF-hand domain-containing protein n=1 Tax=Calcidiscus leptoporus TaxID=127549 RepID=A0A7S0J618_9EUKA|mmetsp:Transcript_41140/g.96106  ORF Transcript_41140/g.96106 Transcript_41140/m.96106 type:complete len:470 (+) Transcript_41140:142-1551(+)|eukprot:CAMPEP_0119375686 /NCGR_PEP_ID=MMETSP1334-20130426/36553_1 /TAXON_ID=127549 /ORGANISM="Calcidiscus leptoporus, Strain RCC1130" /LENGTH=469 /DNA_ID=CAMNT_0007394059 /DNA_START=142 /DNA_END=1551 /DNA_ORIENTATION=-